jgi:hypothetical protein
VNALQVITCLGLGAAAGLNVTLPVLIVAVFAWSGVLSLERPFTVLGSGPMLWVLGLLAAFEMQADKTVARRGHLHLRTLPLSIGSAALLCALALHGFGASRPGLGFALPLVAACLVAGGVHVGRTLLRPTAHGIGPGTTLLVSWLEDVLSVLLSLVAVLAPWALLGIFVLVLAAAARLGLWMRGAARQAREWLGSAADLCALLLRRELPALLKERDDRT